jgi:hypothetical protein
VRLHFHRDRNWTVAGTNRYYQCSVCGARRTVRLHRNQISPTAAGWPLLIDQAGRPVMDSGWQKMPPDRRVRPIGLGPLIQGKPRSGS